MSGAIKVSMSEPEIHVRLEDPVINVTLHTIGTPPAGFVVKEFTVTSDGETNFDLETTYRSAVLLLNGLKKQKDVDYEENDDGTSFDYLGDLEIGDLVEVLYVPV